MSSVNAQKVLIGGLVQLTVRVKPARKARAGGNPRPVSGSRSPRGRPALTCALERWREREARCARCRRLASGSLSERGRAAGPASNPSQCLSRPATD